MWKLKQGRTQIRRLFDNTMHDVQITRFTLCKSDETNLNHLALIHLLPSTNSSNRSLIVFVPFTVLLSR
ncbi:hypothetical protein PILCRDRAFT_170759 [Piloderma croceum F 1598]|uniref:Uncharacterized protein n=1 Tax=Piloderma croceum (strain F 1598) TaxID=765440 RepID=A0A0C3GHY0_PILCF|nr:hypothetical protein PILCRDRAFT_170759 [Piloderma croceum F 1598]